MPLSFNNFIGNKGVVGKLRLLTTSAIEKKGKLPHLLFLGSTGNGKTRMAQIIADETQKRLVHINSVAIKDAMVFRGIITHPDNMKYGAIIFVDECHRLPAPVQDHLLSVLENPAELVTVHKGVLVRDNLPSHMSFIFATTHGGLMRDALINRLDHVEFSEYTVEEKQQIAATYFTDEYHIAPQNIEPDATFDIGRRCRSARHVNKVCDNIIRYMEIENKQRITQEVVSCVFTILAVDSNGLTPRDKDLLMFLAKNGRCGLDTLEAFLNIPKKDIREKLEPWLLRRGLIERSSSGRAITHAGAKALIGERV